MIRWEILLNKFKNLPESSATSEHIQFFKDLFDLTRKEYNELIEKSKALEKEIEELNTKLLQDDLSEYDDVNGVLWKRKSFGEYENKPYCPSCQKHPVMSVFPQNLKLYWLCSCGATYDYIDVPGLKGK